MFIAGPVILWFVCEHFFRNYAAYIGQLAGQGLVLSLLAMIVLTRVRKKISTALIVGVVFLGSSAHIAYQASQDGADQREIANEMVDLYDSVQSGKEISGDTVVRENDSLLESMKKFAARGQQITMEYQNAIADVGTPITPENLVNTAATKKARSQLVIIGKDIPSYESRLLANVDDMGEILSKRTDKDSRDYYMGFISTRDIAKQYVRDLYDVQSEMITTMIDMLDFAIAREGKLGVENGQLMFQDQSSVDAYNALFRRIILLSEMEEKIVLDEQKRMAALTSKIK